MKKKLLGGLGVIAALFALQFAQTEVYAGLFDRLSPCAEVGECNPCDVAATDCDPCGNVDACYTKKSKWFVNGYIETGFFANEYGAKNQYDNALPRQYRTWNQWSGNTKFLQNVGQTGGQLNQLYISTGRAVDGKHGLDIGGTVDFTFGTDARFVQAAGFEYQYDNAGAKEWQWGTGDYYSAFAQAYFEAAYKKWNVKVGKVYAPFGSNSYKSTDRFFYSLADTFAMVPATALAAYTTYTVNKKFSVYAGWAQPDQFGETSHDNAFLFGFDWDVGKRLHIAYALGVGENDRYKNAATPYTTEYFVQSLVATYKISSKLTSIFDWSLFNTNYKGTNGNTWEYIGGIYGINTELIYQYNSRWAFGFRSGWGRDINDYWYNDKFAHTRSFDNKYTFSLGANWTPRKWLTIKSELRYDKFEGTRAFNTTDDTGDYRDDAEHKKDQFAGGISAIVKF
ncbi:MAG: porin [Planctomycetaceae bacterium]|jgi:hypothetical protein|nr:porin [Planctomycetaceae bacterium]